MSALSTCDHRRGTRATSINIIYNTADWPISVYLTNYTDTPPHGTRGVLGLREFVIDMFLPETDWWSVLHYSVGHKVLLFLRYTRYMTGWLQASVVTEYRSGQSTVWARIAQGPPSPNNKTYSRNEKHEKPSKTIFKRFLRSNLLIFLRG